jgi:Flp pilus assembly pilin Flp
MYTILKVSRSSYRQRGATLVEYALLVALISIVSIVAVRTLGRNARWSSTYASCQLDIDGACALYYSPAWCAARTTTEKEHLCIYYYAPIGTPNPVFSNVAGWCRVPGNYNAMCSIG